jgi:hypothetical protein
MSQAFWNELQAVKSRIDTLEQRVGVPPPPADGLARLLARLDLLEHTLEKQRQGKR